MGGAELSPRFIRLQLYQYVTQWNKKAKNRNIVTVVDKYCILCFYKEILVKNACTSSVTYLLKEFLKKIHSWGQHCGTVD